jgi:hypothetical protein
MFRERDTTMLHAVPGLRAYRQRTLTQLEGLIARAERELTCHQTTDGHPSVSGQASARIADKLRLATERLALLRRSRQFLLSDEFLSAPYQRH